MSGELEIEAGKKYRVAVPWIVWATIEVVAKEGDEVDDLRERAIDETSLDSYSGNGAVSGKLVGTSEEDVWLEASDQPVQCDGIDIEIEECEE